MVKLMVNMQIEKPNKGWVGKECSYLQHIIDLEKGMKKHKNVLKRDILLKQMKNMNCKKILLERMKKIDKGIKCEILPYDTLNCIKPQTETLVSNEPDGIRNFPDNILYFLALNPKKMNKIKIMIKSTVKDSRADIETIFNNFEETFLKLKSTYDFDTVYKLLELSKSLPQRQELLIKQNNFLSNGGFKQLSTLNTAIEKQLQDIELNSLLILRKFSNNKNLIKSHEKEFLVIKTLHTLYKDKREQFNENKEQFEKTKNDELCMLENRKTAEQEEVDKLGSFLKENKTVMKAIKNNMDIVEQSREEYLKPWYFQLMAKFSNIDEKLIVKDIFMNAKSLNTVKAEITESFEDKRSNFYYKLERVNSTIVDNIQLLCLEFFEKNILKSIKSLIDVKLVSEQLDSFSTYLEIGTLLAKDINKIQNGCQQILKHLSL